MEVPDPVHPTTSAVGIDGGRSSVCHNVKWNVRQMRAREVQ